MSSGESPREAQEKLHARLDARDAMGEAIERLQELRGFYISELGEDPRSIDQLITRMEAWLDPVGTTAVAPDSPDDEAQDVVNYALSFPTVIGFTAFADVRPQPARLHVSLGMVVTSDGRIRTLAQVPFRVDIDHYRRVRNKRRRF